MLDEVLQTHTMEDIGHGICEGRIDPRELTEYFLDRINSDIDKETIFIDVFTDQARKDAEDSHKRFLSNSRLSLYDGIPLVWKDNFDIKGRPTTVGVKALLKNVAIDNSAAYEAAAKVGFICLGKTNMTELAFSGLGINPSFGTPSNPFDSENLRVPGGSSSGSAVAVSKGLCCAAIGTDTGGSVRTPAAWNSLVGLKTTAGLISTKGIAPLSQTLDTVGFITRSVGDAATLYHVIAQTEKVNLTRLECKNLNLLVCTNTVFDGVSSEVLTVFNSCMESVQKRGATIVRQEIPEIKEVLDLVHAKGNIVSYEASKNWNEFIQANSSSISEDILDRFQSGFGIRETDIAEVYQQLKIIKQRYLERTEGYHAVLMPTVACEPPIISELEQDSERYAAENFMSLRNTRIANLLELCAISLPAGFTPLGLPVGLMLMASPFSEVALLRVAAGIEQAMLRAS
jgi:aspartyl-tRNA(Asn)/glutamyl-tRNA(Gln) amidotransferase subunit A